MQDGIERAIELVREKAAIVVRLSAEAADLDARFKAKREEVFSARDEFNAARTALMEAVSNDDVRNVLSPGTLGW